MAGMFPEGGRPLLPRLALAACFLLGQLSVCAAGSQAPHPHQGKAAPYKPGMPDISLSRAQLTALEAGELVQDLLRRNDGEDGTGGRALAVQDVNAPVEYVWDRILDFGKYNKMVPKVADCKNYETQRLRNGTEVIKTDLKLNVFGVKMQNYIYHTYFPYQSSLTWTLDYSRRSTLDDSVGFWHVAKHPSKTKPDWSRVYYSVKLEIPSWIPGLVIAYLNKQALREATTWVRRESEKQYMDDLASGRTLLSAPKGPLNLPAWDGFRGLRDAAASTSWSPQAKWVPSWARRAEPEPEPEPEEVPGVGSSKRKRALRWVRRTALGIGGLWAGLTVDSAIAGEGGCQWGCGSRSG